MESNDHGSPTSWRTDINGILYTVQFASELDTSQAQRVADMILQGTAIGGGAALFRASIDQALAQPDALNDDIQTPHTEQQIRAFLAELRGRLG